MSLKGRALLRRRVAWALCITAVLAFTATSYKVQSIAHSGGIYGVRSDDRYTRGKGFADQLPFQGAESPAAAAVDIDIAEDDAAGGPGWGILSKKLMRQVASVLPARYIKLEGFQYCSILNGATFDAFTRIHPLGGSIAEINPTTSELVKLLDDTAIDTKRRLTKRYKTLYDEDADRYACYATAEGANPYVNISSEPLLKRIDPLNYYGKLIPSIAPHDSLIPGPRRKYKLAYLMMIHKVSTWQQLQDMIEILDDGNAIFLIHVDVLATELSATVKAWIEARDKAGSGNDVVGTPRLGNVFLAQTTYEGMWGHVSLVWMQLSGFWELLDLADWEYVINLSAHDWPLRTSQQIYETLNSTKHKGMEHIEWWTDPADIAGRTVRPHFGRMDRPSIEYSTIHPPEVGLAFPPLPSWSLCKQHQWMILTSEFIRDLRTNIDGLHMLAFMEHMWIPDEAYFCTVISNHPYFSHRVVKDKKRYLRFNAQHPAQLTIKDIHLFPPEEPRGAEAKYFFIRKVNTQDSPELAEWLKNNHIDKHDLAKAPVSPEKLAPVHDANVAASPPRMKLDAADAREKAELGKETGDDKQEAGLLEQEQPKMLDIKVMAQAQPAN
ncbi:core-2/I-branching enzyme-domain-containing protein [Fimicolochytrium jonesii]|uniref:core-2/I-branching enzyme-domain-containing protein n=1 Tax=Fimicolochytrium jonesii TaxID=1396493 RepID=UPI0022FE7D42|nr:core-2/I-branching enzyme-domain-containing protein [Fimicolochytrium jonesii]KAI8824198.1 core-2/I-branching enzyme-domain-containing protein [Fimicolochytrium jonesii]